jgi:phosphate transport system ATP-binding protein
VFKLSDQLTQPELQPVTPKMKTKFLSNSSNSELAEPLSSIISMEDFCAWYGDFQALHNLKLDIPENRVTAFIGPSGCGKSTLLKWINRMNDIVPGARASGKMVLPDIDILARSTDVVALRRRIGIVFQKPNPFPKSIFDNIAFGPRLHFSQLSKPDLDDLVEWALKKAALWTNQHWDYLADSNRDCVSPEQSRLGRTFS